MDLTKTARLAVVSIQGNPQPCWINYVPGEPYPVVCIEKNGSVRECTLSERKFLETPFELDDGARPYIVSKYKKRKWWQLSTDWGFCLRTNIPDLIVISVR